MNVVDDDGDLDLNRPERIDLSLGITMIQRCLWRCSSGSLPFLSAVAWRGSD